MVADGLGTATQEKLFWLRLRSDGGVVLPQDDHPVFAAQTNERFLAPRGPSTGVFDPLGIVEFDVTHNAGLTARGR